ncbi:MAG: branched-chain amino acid ABC transporter ATP-binding protein [Hydrogenophaga sp.]|uniref:branched-chain amino acid ABC transporter ATP-binding protein n=1 Tax=Hydrogenophaga sp. TaxID=1904254 RepID=UPI00403658A5
MLRIENMDACYGLFQALFRVNLEAARGETLALIGSNGAGKSTLLRAIAGAIRVGRSTITLDGKAIGGDPEHSQIANGIALVPEGRRLFADLTVEENLLVAAGAAKKIGRTGEWTPERLFKELPALDPLRSRPATALSGGQQQLVAIARSLVMNPQILMCDEVSLGLSPVAVDVVYQLLRKVKQAGTAVIMVEQNVSRALAESDHYCCLQKGRVVLKGVSAQADYGRVAHAYFGA